MSTNHTTNYNLNQWEATDKVLRTEFNADNAKIDAALKANADTIDTLEGQVEALQTEKGDCQLYTTSYIGNGGAGANQPCSITFPRKPFYLIISSPVAQFMFCPYGQNRAVGIKVNFERPCYWLITSWSGNTFTWYANSDSAEEQLNQSGVTFSVLAFLEAGT